jgi:hypothetical protein
MLAVVAEEPLRESAQVALIEARLAEGNAAETRRTIRGVLRAVMDGAAVTSILGGAAEGPSDCTAPAVVAIRPITATRRRLNPQ